MGSRSVGSVSTQQHDHDQDHADDEQSGGQVSDVSMMDGAEADTPIQPDQSVAGSSDDEPGSVDEGAQGPNANPNAGASGT